MVQYYSLKILSVLSVIAIILKALFFFKSIYQISSSQPSNEVGSITYPHFFQIRHCGSKRLSDIPKVTQL